MVRPPLGDDFAHPRYGYAIRREKLDPMVRELAAQEPGVELLLGETATALLGANGRPAGVRVVDRGRRERDISLEWWLPRTDVTRRSRSSRARRLE